MFLKLKIYFTIISLYEVVAILLLHSKMCQRLFSLWFCGDSFLKYFVFCIVLPLLVVLLVMWISEIKKRIRRRRSLLYQAKEQIKEIKNEVIETVKTNLTPQDIELGLAAVLSAWLKKQAEKNQENVNMPDITSEPAKPRKKSTKQSKGKKK